MKYTLTVSDAESYFERLENSKMFTCEKSMSGLSLRYNGIFTLIGNPKINIIKLSETEIEIKILPSFFLPILSAVFTIFFWALGVALLINSGLHISLIILIFLLPSIIWILQIFFNKAINKQIINELKKEDSN
ncbi:MAG: hypothetical protein J1E36_04960 [Eubacterium sp.]|nr:hypothetical protein [Eubacterium sp.]